MAKIDHAAIRTASYENAQKFFEDVFEMHMWREIGEKPEQQEDCGEKRKKTNYRTGYICSGSGADCRIYKIF